MDHYLYAISYGMNQKKYKKNILSVKEYKRKKNDKIKKNSQNGLSNDI